MATAQPAYPVTFTVDYPAQLNRLTTAFRIILVIPIAIVLGLVSNGSGGWDTGGADQAQTATVTAGGILFLPTLLMLLFRRKYPGWWFDWNLAFTRFGARVGAYFALLRDEYPSIDEEQAVHLEIERPDGEQLNRWLPLVKWLLVIPHFIVLFFLAVAAIVVTIVAWFAILFTGKYPAGMFDFVVGVMRWAYRVEAYAIILTTDRYPPFSLD
jgi:hypothetical protein